MLSATESLSVHSQSLFGPSFCWRCIRCSRALLKEGHRWRIGDGTNIRVWNQQWLRGSADMCVSTAPTSENLHMTVNDLHSRGGTLFGIGRLLPTIFNANDVHQIMNVPLLECVISDSVLWSYTKNGQYSVKSRDSRQLDELVVTRSPSSS